MTSDNTDRVGNVTHQAARASRGNALDGDADLLRQLVREVLTEALPDLAGPIGGSSQAQPGPLPPSPPTSDPAADPPPSGTAYPSPEITIDPRIHQAGAEAWTVRLSTDDELHAFVLRVLRLADNPKARRDLISGRARFRLAAQSDGAAASAVHRVDKGAVTERLVTAAAAAGARLVLGPRAVLTPLARDKARTLGVPIEKER